MLAYMPNMDPMGITLPERGILSQLVCFAERGK